MAELNTTKINGNISATGTVSGTNITTMQNEINELNDNLETLNANYQPSIQRGVATGSLNNTITEGTYWCDFSNITDAPWTDGYGWLEVARYNDGMQCVQRITRYSTAHIKNVIAIRFYTNNQWYPWWHDGDEIIDITDFITANSSITIDTESSVIRKTGNRMRGIIYCTGSVTTSTAGNVTIGTISSSYRPNIRSHQGAIINTHTSGQVQAPATLLIYSGGNLLISTGLTSTQLGNSSYPWCTQLGIAFDYQL